MLYSGDRREHFRLEHKATVRFKVIKDGELVSYPDVVTDDISLGGIRVKLQTYEELPPGTVAWVELDGNMLALLESSYAGIQQELVMSGSGVYCRVVRFQREQMGAEASEVALRFLRRDELSEEELESFLDEDE